MSYSILIDGNNIVLSRERDETDYIFRERIKYVYKHLKNNLNDNPNRHQLIYETLNNSLCLKNKILYNVVY